MSKRKLREEDEPFLRALLMVAEFAERRNVPLSMACGILLGRIEDAQKVTQAARDKHEEELAAIAEGWE